MKKHRCICFFKGDTFMKQSNLGSNTRNNHNEIQSEKVAEYKNWKCLKFCKWDLNKTCLECKHAPAIIKYKHFQWYFLAFHSAQIRYKSRVKFRKQNYLKILLYSEFTLYLLINSTSELESAKVVTQGWMTSMAMFQELHDSIIIMEDKQFLRSFRSLNTHQAQLYLCFLIFFNMLINGA